VSRALQHELHSRLTVACEVLDLPLTDQHLERLAVELTPAITAMLAGRDAAIAELEPVPYTLADAPEGPVGQAMDTSEYAGCLCRIAVDVDLDSPAVALAERLRASQPDVVATEVTDPATLGLTVRPQSLDCWRWWLGRLNVTVDSVRMQGDAVTGTGSYKGVTVHLRGDGVPDLLADKSAARLAGVLTRTVR
jgi:hypothetical protein